MAIPTSEIAVADRLAIEKNAKSVLDRVCSGAALDPHYRYDSPNFVDHVNDLQFYGLEANPGKFIRALCFAKTPSGLYFNNFRQAVMKSTNISRSLPPTPAAALLSAQVHPWRAINLRILPREPTEKSIDFFIFGIVGRDNYRVHISRFW